MTFSFRESPIFITGAARSGTSLVSGIVHKCGAWGGDMRGETRYNPKGMFENKAIINEIIKPYLREWNCDPLGQLPLPKTEAINLISEKEGPIVRNRVLEIIKSEGYNSSQVWFAKAAKFCLMWPIWAKAFPLARWIIVRRNADDIVRSCLKTGFMRGYSSAHGWCKWVAKHERLFDEMHDACLNIREIWPQEIINGDMSKIKALICDFGLDWQETGVLSFVDPGLWKRKIK